MISVALKVVGFLVVAGVLLVAGPGHTDELQPFVSDGCSVFPDGTPGQKELWRSCCVDHDRAYWQGGSRGERMVADEALQECVAAAGAPTVAVLMKIGVWFGGTPYLPFHFRWGFGWPYSRGYKALTKFEQLMVEKSLAEEGGQQPLAAE
jgi:hypothetical protein